MIAARRRAFDVLAVYQADRTFRSSGELVLTLDELCGRGVAFVSVTEPELEIASDHRPLLAALARVERGAIAERTRVGFAEAMRRGRVGRPPKLAGVNARRARMLRESGESFARIAELLGVGVATVHRALVPKTPS